MRTPWRFKSSHPHDHVQRRGGPLFVQTTLEAEAQIPPYGAAPATPRAPRGGLAEGISGREPKAGRASGTAERALGRLCLDYSTLRELPGGATFVRRSGGTCLEIGRGTASSHEEKYVGLRGAYDGAEVGFNVG